MADSCRFWGIFYCPSSSVPYRVTAEHFAPKVLRNALSLPTRSQNRACESTRNRVLRCLGTLIAKGAVSLHARGPAGIGRDVHTANRDSGLHCRFIALLFLDSLHRGAANVPKASASSHLPNCAAKPRAAMAPAEQLGYRTSWL